MHSCETIPPPQPATGATLLQQLGRLIIRARSRSPARTQPPAAEPRDRLIKAKLLKNQPSTSQVCLQPRADAEPRPDVEAQLDSHVQAMWTEQIPICIEVLLAPDCPECFAKLSKTESEAAYDKSPHQERRGLLLERWTMSVLLKKGHEAPSYITSQWLLSGVRSQLHFSQLSAWLSRLTPTADTRRRTPDITERRRKLSRETCNFKKLESNCDVEDLPKTSEEPLGNGRRLNVVYSIKLPGETYKMSDFSKPPTDHTFPVTDIGNNVYLKVILESLPRTEDIPKLKCTCIQTQPKRRASKEMPSNSHEEIMARMNDLTLGPTEDFRSHFDSINSNIGGTSTVRPVFTQAKEFPDKKEVVVDDRMHTTCSEKGKHKCNCDDESDQGKEVLKSKTKNLDERRLKEIAKYKRRLRKESKMRKIRDSNSESTGNSEGDIDKKKNESHTSIPILQAARFDRLRAIGCYRNQTYLTLPASRIESKSPFMVEAIPAPEFKKTISVATQTDDLKCDCGNKYILKCEECSRGMVRSEANYNLSSIDKHRKHDDAESLNKKLKCDIASNSTCDKYSYSKVRKCDDELNGLIKRPKLKGITSRLEKIVNDRNGADNRKDMDDLHLKGDDSVFVDMSKKPEKRQKHSSIGDEDYSVYEKCYYGTFDRFEADSPGDSPQGFECPPPEKVESTVPSSSEVDKFRWRFDSAASMVFHTKTGLPLTSSPAPLKRGSHCFDYDDSINGINGIKSALSHRARTPRPRPPPPAPRAPQAALLGSFEESALKGRLEPVATVHGFTAELAACGAFCPPHRRLPVTVFFYAPGGTNAPYMGHINLGSGGYRVPSSGTVQVSLFNPHGTLVKMFVVLYELCSMPPCTRTFLRQRTLYLPAGSPQPPQGETHKYMRYLIHLRFMTSSSGKLYLHTDIRIIVSRKADIDTASAHSALTDQPTNNNRPTNAASAKPANEVAGDPAPANSKPCRVFGGCSDFKDFELGYENQNGVSYELRSFTYGPENPKYSPR